MLIEIGEFIGTHLRIAISGQYFHLLEQCNLMEVEKCTDVDITGVVLTEEDITGGGTDVLL